LTDFGLLRQHGNDSPQFIQGRIAVDYAPGLIRRSTFSDVLVNGIAGQSSAKQLGDQANMTIDGYRFSTSFNKGFATVLQWLGNDGDILLGAINFPSYPEHEWKQINDWTTPGGEHIGLELELAAMADQAHAWRLQSEGVDFTIKITLPDGTTARLGRGESLSLHGGQLTVADLRMWMGYRVDSNPMLQWVFVAALLSIAALSMHFYERYWNVGRHHVSEARGRRHAHIC
jgi:cytochrome c biogenesis protein